jgi:hypothetical protein
MRKKKRMNIVFFFFFTLYTVVSSIKLLLMFHTGDWESAQRGLGLWFVRPIVEPLINIVIVESPRSWSEFGMNFEMFVFIWAYFMERVCIEIPLWPYVLLGWC